MLCVGLHVSSGAARLLFRVHGHTPHPSSFLPFPLVNPITISRLPLQLRTELNWQHLWRQLSEILYTATCSLYLQRYHYSLWHTRLVLCTRTLAAILAQIDDGGGVQRW